MLNVIVSVALLIVVAICWMPPLSELLCLLRRRRSPTQVQHGGPVPRLLFLVPAHNEELLISSCIRSLLDQSYPPEARSVFVVADNCSDATARLAAEQGARVLERRDPAFAGKPRAIAWALEQIELKEWDSVVIVDADSVVAPDFAAGLAPLGPLNDIVFQPNNLVLNEFETWLTRLGGLLGRSMFQVTFPLKQSAGLNCPVANGMGIGTNLLIRDGWRSVSITEDSELYVTYTEAGVPIRHASGASIFSQESRSLSEGGTQRRRWLAGRMWIVREWGMRILRSRRISWHQKLDVFVSIALCNPVLHLLTAVAISLIAYFTLSGAMRIWIPALALASLASLGVATTITLWRHPQPWRTLSSFMLLPVYAAWRLGVVVGTLFTLRDVSWRRSARTAPGTVAVTGRS
jgi:cellulose synthase/poly-beta-1,6-N-acetylglucosamine synthase-like glycosyltransferase